MPKTTTMKFVIALQCEQCLQVAIWGEVEVRGGCPTCGAHVENYEALKNEMKG